LFLAVPFALHEEARHSNGNIILFDWNKPVIFALIGQAKLSGRLPEEEEEYVVYSAVQQDVNIGKSWSC